MKGSGKLPKILVIVGPTASGKTALSIKLTKQLNGEIISADSRQIYWGMDVGTAKPTKKEMDSIPHYLIDIKNPNQNYTVADYKKDAIKAIKKILAKGKLPILVGGTGLYVKAVVENLNIPKVKENSELRRKLELELKTNGLDSLFKKLIECDPEAAYIVDPKNPRRVIRALEVSLTTGKPFTSQRKMGKPLFDAHIIGITLPNEKLRTRIEKRVDEMMRDGLVKETKKLYARYGKVKALEAIGYREIIDYLDGKLSLKEAIFQIKLNTWHYAKRQMTWFRKNTNITWIKEKKNALEAARLFLKEKKS